MTARLRRCAGQWRGAPRVAILLSLSVALLTSTASTTAHAQSGIVLASDNFDRPDESPLVVGGNWQRSLSSGAANLAANRVSGVSGDAVYFWQGSGTLQYATICARKSGPDDGPVGARAARRNRPGARRSVEPK